MVADCMMTASAERTCDLVFGVKRGCLVPAFTSVEMIFTIPVHSSMRPAFLTETIAKMV